MRMFVMLSAILLIGQSWAQKDIRATEESMEFSVGSKNSIVVNVPEGNPDVVKRALYKEMKDWGGKTDESRGEYKMTQGVAKFMGDKPFDAYAKIIIDGNNNIRVAVAVDLGGAFMTSREHQVQYTAMVERLKTFASEASEKSMEELLKKEEDKLSDMQKDLRKLEKDKEDDESDIAKYKRKIEEAEKRIAENIKNQEQAKKDIDAQFNLVKEIERRKKNIR